MCTKLVLILVLVVKVNCSVFNEVLYAEVLDSEECERQLIFLSNDSFGLQFLDASGKIPPGILGGNLNNMGDYYQCLDIQRYIDDFDIQGKYCTVTIPLQQNPIQNPFIQDLIQWINPYDGVIEEQENYRLDRQNILDIMGVHEISPYHRTTVDTNSALALEVAVCVPRVCTASQALDFLMSRLVIVNITYTEKFCRLPNDKPFVAADYIAIVLLSVIAMITIISTGYDLLYIFVWKTNPSKANKLLRSFSIYTNTNRLLTVRPCAGALDCLDGIRVISMLWVIVGHTFIMNFGLQIRNMQYVMKWIRQLSSIWVLSAPITVDTFFLLSGVLCVYATIGKIERNRFIQNIPMFYLHRLLRMFPLLAVMVLLQSSLINHMSDGPYWGTVATATTNCREKWWLAILHVQNYFTDGQMCLNQSWYLSVDIQLYILCPVVLVWLFGKQRYAWSALFIAVIVSLISASVISFQNNFPSSLFNFERSGSLKEYFVTYYVNTLTRAPPFFVGMVYGYILHLWRGKIIRISRVYCCILWVSSLTMMGLIIYSFHFVMQRDFDRQLLDNLLNSYMRAFWAMALGWIIIACAHGYGGPVNWFLSQSMWKVPARISYAMYLIHISVIYLANGSAVGTHYFTVGETLYRFVSNLTFTVLAAFVLCITIDGPFSVLLKMLLQRKRKLKRTESLETVVADKTNDTTGGVIKTSQRG